MEFILLLILFICMVGFIWGLSIIFGLGWALLIFDVIFHHTPLSDYSRTQKSYPSANKKNDKLMGLFIVMLSILVSYFIITRF